MRNDRSQPTWDSVALRQYSCSQMFHKPDLLPREWAQPSRIEKYLQNVGFSRIQTTSREFRLEAQDESSMNHMVFLVSQATYMAHLNGMPWERAPQYQEALVHEALTHGLKARRQDDLIGHSMGFFGYLLIYLSIALPSALTRVSLSEPWSHFVWDLSFGRWDVLKVLTFYRSSKIAYPDFILKYAHFCLLFHNLEQLLSSS